jgi:ABC-type nitrate/sulfonate/bicarbonate transport system substrate-binding protein
MNTIKLALDWTPNINHIGFFVARELGFYQQNDIDLQLLSPKDDNYDTTPGKKLDLGLVDFAIAPFETVISLNNKSNPLDAVAVYAILQRDLSSITALTSADIQRPRDLDGRIYASYHARYEDHIVKQMIINDGGKGDMVISYPEKLGIWNTLLEGKADATWIFDNWEGVEAHAKQVSLVKFSLNDYNIPYGYSPVLVASFRGLHKQMNVSKAFIRATQKGYAYANNNRAEAAEIMKPYLTQHDQLHIDLLACLDLSAPHFAGDHGYGYMEDLRVQAFLHWLVDCKLEHKRILDQSLYTNDFLR